MNAVAIEELHLAHEGFDSRTSRPYGLPMAQIVSGLKSNPSPG